MSGYDDPVQFDVDRRIFAAARKAYAYTPADERPERVAEEAADPVVYVCENPEADWITGLGERTPSAPDGDTKA